MSNTERRIEMRAANKSFVKVIVSFLIVIFIVGIGFATGIPFSHGNASAESEQEVRVYSPVFAEDRVLVVLSDRATKSFRNYTKDDFSEIEISSIKELTKSSKEKVLKQLNDVNVKDTCSNNYEMRIDADIYRRILCLTLVNKGKENVLKAIELLKRREDIISAEPDCVLHVEATNPNDPDYQNNKQWGLNGDHGINTPSAWNYTAGSSAIRVGIIDTGIDASHGDLSANVNTALSRDFSLAEPYIPSTVVDSDSHGTHVAGIVGAVGNNGIGITGVTQSIELISLKIYPTSGHNSFVSNLILAIDYATSANIPILNNSNGTDNYLGTEDSLSAFSTAITNYPGLFVTSAGNKNRNNDLNNNRFPKIQLSNTITVGAIDLTGSKASFSNYGETSVDIFAPGNAIYSTLPSNNYGEKSGTSMATPHVTGVAALILSYIQDIPHNMTTKQLSNQIKTTILDNAIVDDGKPLEGLCVSGGRLNAFGSVYNFPARVTAMSGFGYPANWYHWDGKVDLSVRETAYDVNSSNQPVFTQSVDLVFSLGTISAYNAWHAITGTVVYELKNSSNETIQIEGNDTFTGTFRVGLVSNVSYTNRSFTINTGSLPNDTYTLSLSCTVTRDSTTKYSSALFTFRVNRSCVAEGSLITLADGSQVAVENLTGNENLLVWNMLTGQFDSAPILFIDSDPLCSYEVINLTFSDGTEVKVIDEHGFFDMTIGKYVFLRRDAAQYIGHYFNKESGNTWTTVQLTNVTISNESTTAWSPVTYGHLCYYVNGMLSMPGATEGLINIFEIDTVLMKYDAAQMAADIQTYGLYTYAEFNAIISLPEYVFNAFNGQYLKVSIGKGLITLNEIVVLLERYSNFFY